MIVDLAGQRFGRLIARFAADVLGEEVDAEQHER